jgi:hypothetical protein
MGKQLVNYIKTPKIKSNTNKKKTAPHRGNKKIVIPTYY